MIIMFQANERDRFSQIAAQMYRLRADVFSARLKWDVTVKDGLEFDEFDDLNPLYITALEADKVVGCLRLLPTTGPTLMTGPMSWMFDDSVDIRNPVIWECTRFAVLPSDDDGVAGGVVGRVSCELLIALCQIAVRSGIEKIVGVIDRRTLPIYRRIGCYPEILARSSTNPNILAGLWEASAKALERMVSNTFSQSRPRTATYNLTARREEMRSLLEEVRRLYICSVEKISSDHNAGQRNSIWEMICNKLACTTNESDFRYLASFSTSIYGAARLALGKQIENEVLSLILSGKIEDALMMAMQL